MSACSPKGTDQDPRNRQGERGALTWRLVSQLDGQAAFLARPGAAPDVVLWCRDDRRIVLRAHVFDNPASQPDLRLITKSGSMGFTDVRRQGGVRAGDRKLVEGASTLADPKVQAILVATDQFILQSGDEKYEVSSADPQRILAGFVATCALMTALPQTKNK